jgi:hypothetical protein
MNHLLSGGDQFARFINGQKNHRSSFERLWWNAGVRGFGFVDSGFPPERMNLTYWCNSKKDCKPPLGQPILRKKTPEPEKLIRVLIWDSLKKQLGLIEKKKEDKAILKRIHFEIFPLTKRPHTLLVRYIMEIKLRFHLLAS